MLNLPTRIAWEGRGAVITDSSGRELHFIDRNDAMSVQAALKELAELRLSQERLRSARPGAPTGS